MNSIYKAGAGAAGGAERFCPPKARGPVARPRAPAQRQGGTGLPPRQSQLRCKFAAKRSEMAAA